MPAKLTFEVYSKTRLAIRGGDRAVYNDIIKNIGGRWNSRMHGGEGWIIPIEQKDIVEALINSLNRKIVEDVDNEQETCEEEPEPLCENEEDENEEDENEDEEECESQKEKNESLERERQKEKEKEEKKAKEKKEALERERQKEKEKEEKKAKEKKEALERERQREKEEERERERIRLKEEKKAKEKEEAREQERIRMNEERKAQEKEERRIAEELEKQKKENKRLEREKNERNSKTNKETKKIAEYAISMESEDPLAYFRSFSKKPVDFRKLYGISDSDRSSYSSSTPGTESSDDFPSPATPRNRQDKTRDNNHGELFDKLNELQRKLHEMEVKNRKLKAVRGNKSGF